MKRLCWKHRERKRTGLAVDPSNSKRVDMYHSPEPLSKPGGWPGQSPATGILSRPDTRIYSLLFIDVATREYINQNPAVRADCVDSLPVAG